MLSGFFLKEFCRTSIAKYAAAEVPTITMICNNVSYFRSLKVNNPKNCVSSPSKPVYRTICSRKKRKPDWNV